MKGNKQQVTKYIDKAKEYQVFICVKEESKEGRTLAQNRTYYKIFKGIGDKLGYSKEATKKNILTALFGTYECKMFGEVHLIPNISSTKELSKEQAIELIDGSLTYAKKIDAGIEITPREVTSLYESYNDTI